MNNTYQPTAQEVATLRASTGIGLLLCKQALVESAGDQQQAKDWLRLQGQSGVATKPQGDYGIIVEYPSDSPEYSAMLALTCASAEVARLPEFRAVAEHALQELVDGKLWDEQPLIDLGQRVRERVMLASAKSRSVDAPQVSTVYVHPGNKIGVMVVLDTDGTAEPSEYLEMAGNVAMHIAASNPTYASEVNVPDEVLQREQALAEEITRREGKPEKMVTQIAQGRVKKWLSQVVLTNQPYVKNPSQTIAQYLGTGVSLVEFTRYEVR